MLQRMGGYNPEYLPASKKPPVPPVPCEPWLWFPAMMSLASVLALMLTMLAAVLYMVNR